jgi:hypothetical protein
MVFPGVLEDAREPVGIERRPTARSRTNLQEKREHAADADQTWLYYVLAAEHGNSAELTLSDATVSEARTSSGKVSQPGVLHAASQRGHERT